MTTVKETLQSDLVTNLKARNELETTTLRAIIGDMQTQEKSGKTAIEFDDAQVLAFMAKEVKKRRDTAQIWVDAGQTARADRETAEADFLSAYLPIQLTEAEVADLVAAALTEFEVPSMKDFGAIMKTVVAAADGRADGKLVSELVKAAIA
jgi:uncharacterized protein YqeY